jgi:hypothetical protein
MVNVTNRPNVYVRLTALKFFFGHGEFLYKNIQYKNRSKLLEPTTGIEPVTSSLPRTCSTN